jgi:hypothetical protein
MTAEDRSAEIYDAIIRRVDIVSGDRTKKKLLAGGNVEGYWGKE